jgi:hypothetical protein
VDEVVADTADERHLGIVAVSQLFPEGSHSIAGLMK